MVAENIEIVWDSGYSLHVADIAEINGSLLSARLDLESRAIEPNPFLSPHFVLPAVRFLEPDSKVEGLLVSKKSAGNNRLVGVGLFRLDALSKYFPLPHLTAFCTRHSFLSGFLIDGDCVEDVMGIMFAFISKSRGKWHGLVIHDKTAEGVCEEIEKRVASELGMRWISFKKWERAILPINERAQVEKSLSRNIRKSLHRRMKRLQEMGEVRFAVRSGDDLTQNVIARFLALENLGWKGERGTSIGSKANDTQFFGQMVENFNQTGQIFFNELCLNDAVVASNVNLISGKAGFAFKLGWDPKFAKLSIGNLLEAHSLNSADPIYLRLDFLDSGADADAAYLNALFPKRRRMTSGIYAVSNAAKALAPLVSLFARLFRSVRNRVRR